jgi:pyruvate formate lyase activating enzyme
MTTRTGGLYLMQKGTIFDIKRFAIHDGPGVRTTVFLKGCPLRCLWCHNPEGQSPDPEAALPAMPVDYSPGVSPEETIGRVVGVQEVMTEIEKDILFFDESGGGVTFSGGEPLAQPQFLHSLLAACKDKNIHTCLDTCGYAPPEVLASVAAHIDLFLYDLKVMDDTQHRKYTGVSNRLILKNLKALDALGRAVVIRFLVIPGITDAEDNVSAIADFVVSLTSSKSVSLLPYHRIASEKYRRLRRKNDMEDVPAPSAETIRSVQARFESIGIMVTIGA